MQDLGNYQRQFLNKLIKPFQKNSKTTIKTAVDGISLQIASDGLLVMLQGKFCHKVLAQN